MSNLPRGAFITLEGGEGTGKSTLARALAARLEARGIQVDLTREPGGTPLAEAARALLLHPPEGQGWSALSEALLVNAARRDHLEKRIRPALAGGTWVLCDRFSDSTRVYQSVSNGTSPQILMDIERAVLGPTRPDLTLVLDLPVDAASLRRAERRGQADSFEKRPAEFHEAVREGFRALAASEPDRCRLIDAAAPPEQVCETAWACLAPLLDPAT